MPVSLPPLNALRTFESAARHLSFRKAAAELHVTPAAVSHQVRLLEDLLGTALFRRLTRAIELTEAGRRLLPEVSRGFAQLAQGVAAVRAHRHAATLSICVPPSFASKWLMPRLQRFVQAFPQIDLRVASSLRLVDSARSDSAAADGPRPRDAEVAIRFGMGKYRGCCVDKLFDVSFTPLCSPALLTAAAPLREPRDLCNYPLLHDDLNELSDGWASWERWFAAAGLDAMAALRGPHFSQPVLGLEAAIDGAGFVLGARELAELDMSAQRLVAPFELSVATGAGYYLVCAADDAADPRVSAFRQWILAETRSAREGKPTCRAVRPASRKPTANASSR